MVDYGGVELYIHTFITTALDQDLPLISKLNRYLHAEKSTIRTWIRDISREEEGQTGQEKDPLHIREMNHVRPDRRIVTIYIEPRRLQTKLQYILVFIQMFKERKSKQMCDIEFNYI